MPKTKQKQVILSVISNAGGSGKTTLATNLAYELARSQISRRPCSVALLDLDPQGSLSLFCGLEKPSIPEQSVSVALTDSFSGSWPVVPCWTEYVLRLANIKALACKQGDFWLKLRVFRNFDDDWNCDLLQW